MAIYSSAYFRDAHSSEFNVLIRLKNVELKKHHLKYSWNRNAKPHCFPVVLLVNRECLQFVFRLNLYIKATEMNTLSKGPKPSTWFQLDKFGSSDPAYVSLDKNMYSETRPISGTIKSLPEGYLFEVFDDSTLKYFYFDPSTMVSFPEKPLDSFVIPASISKVPSVLL